MNIWKRKRRNPSTPLLPFDYSDYSVTDRELLKAWKKKRWSHKCPHFLMFSLRILMVEETVMLVCKPRLWNLIFLCFTNCVNPCLKAFLPFSCHDCWACRSIEPPDVNLSCWSARHVVPNCQTNAGLFVQALQMYRRRSPVLKYCMWGVVFHFGMSYSYRLTVIWSFSREPSSRVYLKKPYLPASSPCSKLPISSLKTRLAHTLKKG